MRGNNPHRAAIQHAANIIRRVRGHPDQRRDADLLRRDANLAGCIQRQRVVLHIDIKRVETRRFRDLRDLDGPRETHGHRRDDLAFGELFFHVIP